MGHQRGAGRVAVEGRLDEGADDPPRARGGEELHVLVVVKADEVEGLQARLPRLPA